MDQMHEDWKQDMAADTRLLQAQDALTKLRDNPHRLAPKVLPLVDELLNQIERDRAQITAAWN